MAFHDRLKEARINAGFTQEQLAEKLGIAKSTLSGYESGNREPTVATISKVMDILQIDANFLYQDETNSPDKRLMPLNQIEMDCVLKYRALDDVGKNTVDYILTIELSRTADLKEAHEALKKTRTYI